MNIQFPSLSSINFQTISHGASQGIRHLAQGLLMGGHNAAKVVAPALAVFLFIEAYGKSLEESIDMFSISLRDRNHISQATEHKIGSFVEFIISKNILPFAAASLTAICIAKRWPLKNLSAWQTALHASVSCAIFKYAKKLPPGNASLNIPLLVIFCSTAGVTVVQCGAFALQGLKHLKSRVIS